MERFKLVIIGDSAVGKTSLASYYTTNKCSNKHIPTVGASYFGADIQVGDSVYAFDIWDTAGQELYRALVPQYARGAAGAILVFDVTKRETFEALQSWLDFIGQEGNDIYIIVAGNKVDLTDDRVVTFDEASTWSRSRGLEYVDTSAITGDGVVQAFNLVAKGAVQSRETSGTAGFHKVIDISETTSAQSSCC